MLTSEPRVILGQVWNNAACINTSLCTIIHIHEHTSGAHTSFLKCKATQDKIKQVIPVIISQVVV